MQERSNGRTPVGPWDFVTVADGGLRTERRSPDAAA